MSIHQVVKTISAVLVAGVLLGGCSNLDNREQRTLSGGALGAGVGAAAGALTGGSWLAGGLIGGAAGAAIGAFTSENEVKVNP
ncbi:hypothetical protein [Thalassobaculum sp.]|jgi:hypothetical protein|uniref:hypothetical protein n=1 Tax=Thalassobaculum sp. TaxID=2022740 RepID=UPI003B5BED27